MLPSPPRRSGSISSSAAASSGGPPSAMTTSPTPDAPRRVAVGHRDRPRAQRGGRDRTEPSARSFGRPIPAVSTSCWSTTKAATAPRRVARDAAAAAGAADRLTVIAAPPRRPGWTGKLFAMNLGFRHVEAEPQPPDYVLFTDADISYEAPDAVERLVQGAEARARCARVADGEAPLRELCRAPARPRLRLLLRQALSLRLGERPAEQGRGGGRRLHAGPPRGARRGRRAARRSAVR